MIRKHAKSDREFRWRKVSSKLCYPEKKILFEKRVQLFCLDGNVCQINKNWKMEGHKMVNLRWVRWVLGFSVSSSDLVCVLCNHCSFNLDISGLVYVMTGSWRRLWVLNFIFSSGIPWCHRNPTNNVPKLFVQGTGTRNWPTQIFDLNLSHHSKPKWQFA